MAKKKKSTAGRKPLANEKDRKVQVCVYVTKEQIESKGGLEGYRQFIYERIK